jgi:acyl-CoA synthetase (AMP-forming)/AMP-acid ligase II
MPGDLLTEQLERWSGEASHRKALILLGDGENETDSLTFADLHSAAAGVAAQLSGLGAAGRPVLVLPRSGIRFAVALMGCQYAGAIAVPCNPGMRNRGRERIEAIAVDCRPAAALVSNDIDDLAATLQQLSVPVIRLNDVYAKAQEIAFRRSPHQPALLQYTSGSTGSPKGVIITDGNLSTNLQMLAHAFRVHDRSIFLTWLPLFHDMGLIANLLIAIYTGVPCVLMPPLSFYQRPDRWLRAISRFGATISGGPNFAFEYLLRRYDRLKLTGIDLSGWDVAFCGAEVVRSSTMQRFARQFAHSGFRASALYPCYGLAEATVFVTGSEPDAGARTTRRGDREVVSCGRPPDGTLVTIVDPDDKVPLADGEIGEIWVAGEHVSPGYWNKPEMSELTFGMTLQTTGDIRFLRTGDLGWMCDGELFFAGRLKDLIVWRGSNVYPEDIEAAAAGCNSAFAAINAAFAIEVGNEEAVVLLQEIARPSSQSFEPARALADLMAGVTEATGFPPYDVALVRPGTLPRTTSGKVQRKRCRELYCSGLPPEMLIATLRSIRTRQPPGS